MAARAVASFVIGVVALLGAQALPSDWSFVAWIAASFVAGVVAADLRLVPVGLLIVPTFYAIVIVGGLAPLGDFWMIVALVATGLVAICHALGCVIGASAGRRLGRRPL